MRRLSCLFALALGCGAPPVTPEPPAPSSASSPEVPAATPAAPASPAASELPPAPAGSAPDSLQRVQAVRALGMVRDAGTANGWTAHISEPFWDRFEVYETQAQLWDRIIALHGLPSDSPLPTSGLVAGLEKRVLLAVAPAEFARLQPGYAAGDQAWTRLLAHEIAHRLHVRVLEGDEDAMGPIWFFEGFATVISGQRLGVAVPITSLDDALEAAKFKGDGAYARYQAAVSWLAERIPLPELVAHAGAAGFESWLAQRLKMPPKE